MKFLEKMFSIRSNKQTYTDFSNEDGITFNSLTESIRNYSQLLSHSQIVEGKTGSHYYFNIEDDSNVIKLLGDEPLGEPINIGGFWDCSPKSLGLEIKINSTLERLYMEKDNEESVIKSILYKPFIKCIEKCIISGTYFDKPLFSTTNTITGTKDFDGLLKLVRRIKEKTDNGCIVGNSTTISEIIDTITNQSYLTEYLLDLFNNAINAIMAVWKRKKRQRKPKRLFLNGCMG